MKRETVLSWLFVVLFASAIGLLVMCLPSDGEWIDRDEPRKPILP